jgi:hypothetical protein
MPPRISALRELDSEQQTLKWAFVLFLRIGQWPRYGADANRAFEVSGIQGTFSICCQNAMQLGHDI